MPDEIPAENPAVERYGRRDYPLPALGVNEGLRTPLRPSEGDSRYDVDVPLCGHCTGRIIWESDGEPGYWRHLDLADLDEPHLAYRDELG